jgi:hypothetical protein
MTNQQHPITPPPYLVEQWEADWHCSGNTNGNGFTYFVATRAAQWGADQELEACCEWLASKVMSERKYPALRAARRPEPMSLKEQALKALDDISIASFEQNAANTIRRALESLPD